MKHELPDLPYDYAALEPHIDARTMALHHGCHHAGYVARLNAALEPFPELQHRSALWLLLNPNKLPGSIRTAVRNNAGGHFNHSLFWRAMAPAAGGTPGRALAEAIARAFGDLGQLKARFAEAGARLFGCGWVWLARAQQDGALRLYSTAEHETPATQGNYPILVNDIWEHAYYLKHENRCDDYLAGWWAVVNWKEAAYRFEHGDPAERHWVTDLGYPRVAAA